MTTKFASPTTITHHWYLADANNKVLGRFASEIANILMGKNKPDFSTNLDTGDCVVVLNAAKLHLTGNKAQEKEYFTHSTYPGGEKILSYQQLLQKDATLPLIHAVKGMLPKNSRGKAMIKKLFVYAGDQHPHAAQKPQPIDL